MNKLIILMGIPGSGKTTIGEILKDRLGFKFIKIDTFYNSTPRVNKDVEWFLDEEYTSKVYDRFENKVINTLKDFNVVLESTGVGPRITSLINNVSNIYNPTILRIYLKLEGDIARKRVFKRNQTDYSIKVDEKDMDFFISKIHEIEQSNPIIIDANKSLDEIVSEIKQLVH